MNRRDVVGVLPTHQTRDLFPRGTRVFDDEIRAPVHQEELNVYRSEPVAVVLYTYAKGNDSTEWH